MPYLILIFFQTYRRLGSLGMKCQIEPSWCKFGTTAYRTKIIGPALVGEFGIKEISRFPR